MQNRIISALFFMIAGLLVITIPLYILPVCPLPNPMSIPSDTAMHDSVHAVGNIMRCHWTRQAEIGIGSVIVVIGLLMLFSRTLFIRMGLSMALACIALLVAAIPTLLIGVCPGEMMDCHAGTLPGEVLLSAVIFIVAILNTLYLNKKAN
ncbi:DUF4418 family protein [Orbaceae bacterium ESL0727]|nr:DUF4418 family protein [Orbaceae bacterium ESL0727]